MDQISNKSINSGKDTTEYYGRCVVFLVENIMFHPRFFSNRSLSFPLDMEAQNTVTVCLKDGQNTKK